MAEVNRLLQYLARQGAEPTMENAAGVMSRSMPMPGSQFPKPQGGRPVPDPGLVPGSELGHAPQNFDSQLAGPAAANAAPPPTAMAPGAPPAGPAASPAAGALEAMNPGVKSASKLPIIGGGVATLAALAAILGLSGGDDAALTGAPTGGPSQAGVRDQFGQNALGPDFAPSPNALKGGTNSMPGKPNLKATVAKRKLAPKKGPSPGEQDVIDKTAMHASIPPAQGKVPNPDDEFFRNGQYSMRAGNR